MLTPTKCEMCEHFSFLFFFYSVNNSPSFLFTFFYDLNLAVSSTSNWKRQTFFFSSFQIVNLIHDVIKKRLFGQNAPVKVGAISETQRRLVTHSVISSSFCRGGGDRYSTVSIHHIPGAPGQEEQRCSPLPCWWPCSEPLIENPAWCTKVWRLQKCTTGRRTRGAQEVNQRQVTLQLFRLNLPINENVYTLYTVPTRCCMCTWRTCWACLFETNSVPMPRGCQAIVLEHLRGAVRAGV